LRLPAAAWEDAAETVGGEDCEVDGDVVAEDDEGQMSKEAVLEQVGRQRKVVQTLVVDVRLPGTVEPGIQIRMAHQHRDERSPFGFPCGHPHKVDYR
jgi:hypothetical protein